MEEMLYEEHSSRKRKRWEEVTVAMMQSWKKKRSAVAVESVFGVGVCFCRECGETVSKVKKRREENSLALRFEGFRGLTTRNAK
jgi:hypothetical protein